MIAAERERVIAEIMRQRGKPLRELTNEALMELAQPAFSGWDYP